MLFKLQLKALYIFIVKDNGFNCGFWILYSGLFLKGFFGYFEEAFLCENKFLGPTVLRKYIPQLIMKCLLALTWFRLCSVNAIYSALMSLYRYFNPRALPDPKGPLSKALTSGSIKAANEAVLAASNRRSDRLNQCRSCRPRPHGDLCDYLLRRTRQFWTNFSFLNIFVNMIATHYRADRKCHFWLEFEHARNA